LYRYIVVDDEIGTLEATSNFVSKVSNEFELAGRFTDGADAWDFLSFNDVELVITDIKMPGMSGIELARKISESGKTCKIIIISGYHDFEYARAALKYGVIDYVTKPINLTEFRHILVNIKNNFDKENDSDEIIELRREQFLTELYFGNMREEDAAEAFEKLHFPFSADKFCGAVIQIEFVQISELINSKWKHEKEQLDMLVRNVFDSITDCFVYPLSHSDNTIKFFVFSENADDDVLNSLKTELEKICEITVNVTALFRFDNLQEIINGRVYKYIENDCIMMLISYIKEGKKELADDLYKHIQSQYESRDDDDIISESINETVQTIKKFIEENYNCDIGRSDVAKIVYMNEVYAGRIFKQCTGKSIHDYHMEIRIRKAIEFLSAGEKISYICALLGYGDKRKFIRHFKNFTGYTPTEYKENVLKLPSE